MLIIAVFFALNFLHSQTHNNNQNGKVTYHNDPKIDSLIGKIYINNMYKPTIKGYRVQIYSGSVRMDAIKAKQDFLNSFPDEKSYLDYKEPDYRVRVGDYHNKIEVQKIFHALLSDSRFKGVLIVPDDINLPELKTRHNDADQ